MKIMVYRSPRFLSAILAVLLGVRVGQYPLNSPVGIASSQSSSPLEELFCRIPVLNRLSVEYK